MKWLAGLATILWYYSDCGSCDSVDLRKQCFVVWGVNILSGQHGTESLVYVAADLQP